MTMTNDSEKQHSEKQRSTVVCGQLLVVVVQILVSAIHSLSFLFFPSTHVTFVDHVAIRVVAALRMMKPSAMNRTTAVCRGPACPIQALHQPNIFTRASWAAGDIPHMSRMTVSVTL